MESLNIITVLNINIRINKVFGDQIVWQTSKEEVVFIIER